MGIAREIIEALQIVSPRLVSLSLLKYGVYRNRPQTIQELKVKMWSEIESVNCHHEMLKGIMEIARIYKMPW